MKKVFKVEELLEALPQIQMIQDDMIREGVCRAWELAYGDSAFEDIHCRFSPFYPGITLLEHHKYVAEKARLLASCIQEEYHYSIRMDYVLAIALIHDICKLRDNIPEGDNIEKSTDGHQMPHAFFSAFYALNAGLPTEIASGALTHSTHTKKVPTSVEAIIVSYADLCDTDMHRIAAGRELNIEAIHRDIKLC